MGKFIVKFLKNEYWYGGNVALGFLMPISPFKPYYCNDLRNVLYNQSAPFYVSTKGRFVWSEGGLKTVVVGNKIIFKSKEKIEMFSHSNNLKDAYLDASKKYFPFDGELPPKEKFVSPQYCTWIELLKNQNQEDIVKYAKSIIESGMPAGELIIDDGWQKGFGNWDFNEKFADPKKMVEDLIKLGFKVSLWIAPFVSPSSPDFEKLKERNALVRDKMNNVAMRKWWNGTDALLDISHPYAVKWFKEQCEWLQHTYGISGFKQDGGDAQYYFDTDNTAMNITANKQSELWAKLGTEYKYNELRAAWKCGGLSIAQRLSDKRHRWNSILGLRALIPNILLLSIIGSPYACADMVGGGRDLDFKPGKKMDNELFVRAAECASLLPMMQYSKSIWKLKNEKFAKMCVEAAHIHEKFADYIYDLAVQASGSGEPIVRYMEYEFPNQNMHKAKQQFMLGNKYLVAPVVHKGIRIKTVLLPKGKWKSMLDDKVYEGENRQRFSVPLNKLLVLEKL